MFFFKNLAENEIERPAPDLFLKKKKERKAFYKVKANGQHLNFNIFR